MSINEKILIIREAIEKHRLLEDRIRELEQKGIEVKRKACGVTSKGVGTQLRFKKKPSRPAFSAVQISYGKGRNRSAYVAIL